MDGWLSRILKTGSEVETEGMAQEPSRLGLFGGSNSNSINKDEEGLGKSSDDERYLGHAPVCAGFAPSKKATIPHVSTSFGGVQTSKLKSAVNGGALV